MNKKGSMELSVNSIVILVIAIVLLGLILGFVKSKFSDLDKQLTNNEPEAQAATPADRLTISRETVAVSGGEEVVLKVQVYAVRAITATGSAAVTPSIKCSDSLALTPVIQAKDVAAGEVGSYIMKVKIPAVAKGKYLCSLNVAFPVTTTSPPDPAINLEKDIVIEVQ